MTPPPPGQPYVFPKQEAPYICLSCGCLVLDMSAHDDFHDRLFLRRQPVPFPGGTPTTTTAEQEGPRWP